MRTYNDSLLTQARSTEQSSVLLVQLASWGGSTVRWADSDADETYSGNTFDARPCSISAPQWGNEAGNQSITLAVANQDLAVSTLISTSNPVGAILTAYRMFRDETTYVQTLASGLYVRTYAVSKDACEFLCSGMSAMMKRQVPALQFSRTCPWVFKGTECGYTGADSTCLQTDDDCISKNNYLNFGGVLFVLPEVR